VWRFWLLRSQLVFDVVSQHYIVLGLTIPAQPPAAGKNSRPGPHPQCALAQAVLDRLIFGLSFWAHGQFSLASSRSSCSRIVAVIRIMQDSSSSFFTSGGSMFHVSSAWAWVGVVPLTA
jgi:hypothetical protein